MSPIFPSRAGKQEWGVWVQERSTGGQPVKSAGCLLWNVRIIVTVKSCQRPYFCGAPSSHQNCIELSPIENEHITGAPVVPRNVMQTPTTGFRCGMSATLKSNLCLKAHPFRHTLRPVISAIACQRSGNRMRGHGFPGPTTRILGRAEDWIEHATHLRAS